MISHCLFYIFSEVTAVIIMAAATSLGPSLHLESREVDLGSLPKDSIKQGVVWVHNSGDEPLVITQVFTDCGCTATEYSKDPIAPGDSTMLRVSFNSHGRGPGRFRKVVRIRSNSRNHTELLFIKGKIKRPMLK